MKKKFDAKKIALTAVTLGVAMILGVAESLLPPVVPALPYFRLGLSNAAILFSVVTLGFFPTLIIVAAKSFLVPIFAMNPVMFVYSLPSAIISFLLAYLFVKIKKTGLPTVGFFSAVFNNIAQVSVAALMTGSAAVFYFLPYLLILGGLSGILTGFAAALIIKTLPANFSDRN